MSWTKGVAIRVERRGPVIDVLELGPEGPGNGVVGREEGRVTPGFAV